MKHYPTNAHTSNPLLPRPRLVRRIQQAFDATHYRGTVVVLAAPGYGKSVLLGEYAASHPGATIIALRPHQLELTQFQAQMARVATSAPILVDDIHLLDQASEITAWLLEELTSAARPWILAGRYAPPALCTHHAVALTLNSTDLVFTPTESRHLLTRPLPSHLDVQLPTADWQRWHKQTGGWPLAVSVLLRRDATTLSILPQGSAHLPA
ncbi:MAG: hypothetical protein WDZ49_16800, partial [Litorilinea sp.]